MQNRQFRTYIPGVSVGLIPEEVRMKYILRHFSHMMPI